MEEEKHISKEAEKFVEEGIEAYPTIEQLYKEYLARKTKEESEEENER